jgi:ribose transport system permease protein
MQGGERLARYRTLLVAYGLIVVLIIVAGILNPHFVSPGNLRQQLVLATFLGMAAAGETVVILTGGIDLSLPWNLNFAAIVLTQVAGGSNAPGRVALAFAAALLVASVVGLINGLGVTLLQIHSLVMTLGMNAVLLGLTLVYTNGTPQGAAPDLAKKLASGRVGPLPWALVLWAAVSIALIFILKRTTFGRRLYAIGNNVRAAYLSGVPIRRVQIGAYTLCGFCMGLTGILLTGYSSQSYLQMGDPYLLPAIAAVVIGGTSILGGSGGYGGTIVGAITVVLLQNTLSVAGISPAGQQVLYGVIILFMLFVYGREGKVRE